MNLSMKEIIDSGDFVKITIPNTKTKICREFTLTRGNLGVNLLEIFRKYASLRKPNTPHERFFVGYNKGKCTTQPVGVNTIGGVPKKIAIYLELKDVDGYTGHCFRRSSATLLADSGASMSTIKRHGGWKSATVVEGYIEGSIANKRKICDDIFGGENSDPVENSSKAAKVKDTVGECSHAEIVTSQSVNISSNPTGVLNSYLKDCTLSNCNINFYAK